MSFLIDKYKEAFIHRYDKDGIIPYLSHLDFLPLEMNKNSFVSSRGVKISYFIYHYQNFKKDKVVLFCPGIGPGHTAYMREINSLCLKGYKVISLDYMGTGESEGDSLYSLNEPTRDVNDLLNHLKLKEEVILMGHSLGGYTSLNIINIRDDIKKAVIISGFLSIKLLLKGYIKLNPLVKKIARYEESLDDLYGKIDNLAYLKSTTDKIMYIHSKDDNNVLFKYGLGLLENINNPNITKVIVDNKLHNPTYTVEAIKYMNDAFASYTNLVKKKKLISLEEKKEYMSRFSALKMTEQDQEIIDMITNFIS